MKDFAGIMGCCEEIEDCSLQESKYCCTGVQQYILFDSPIQDSIRQLENMGNCKQTNKNFEIDLRSSLDLAQI